MRRLTVDIIVGILIWLPALAFASQEPYGLVIKDHKFEPARLTIPANTKVKILIENQDATPEEFESFELNREKVVTGKGKIVVFIGPLKAGTYKFFGDFHKETAQGQINVE
ncbi:MAG: cupredoxin domain-containing protein [Candidatus Omnitrophica bacterium]|nr:cupredoxin domain-containing protein [Candidatus Omnitrophota bacterium]